MYRPENEYLLTNNTMIKFPLPLARGYYLVVTSPDSFLYESEPEIDRELLKLCTQDILIPSLIQSVLPDAVLTSYR